MTATRPEARKSDNPKGDTPHRTTGVGIPRRTFLQLAIAGIATASAGTAAASQMRRQARASSPPSPYALIIDATRCKGDGACVEACRLQNDLPAGHSFIRILQNGDEQHPRFLPLQCQHCASPPCVTVCPTNATHVRDDGVVMLNQKLCVGCKYCMTACPYQARVFDEERGVVDKCWLCLDRVQAGLEPACASACVVGARIFGRTDDPNSEVSQLIASGRARPLHPEFGTEPGILRYVIEE